MRGFFCNTCFLFTFTFISKCMSVTFALLSVISFSKDRQAFLPPFSIFLSLSVCFRCYIIFYSTLFRLSHLVTLLCTSAVYSFCVWMRAVSSPSATIFNAPYSNSCPCPHPSSCSSHVVFVLNSWSVNWGFPFTLV